MRSSLADTWRGTAWGNLGPETLDLHFTATFGLDFHVTTGFFFRHVDAGVKVIFVFGGWGGLGLTV